MIQTKESQSMTGNLRLAVAACDGSLLALKHLSALMCQLDKQWGKNVIFAIYILIRILYLLRIGALCVIVILDYTPFQDVPRGS